MRSLLILLILGGFVWMICRFFYNLGRKNQKLEDEAAATNRKKVDSFVVDNENHSNGGDKQDKK
jgi:hypothetical protein